MYYAFDMLPADGNCQLSMVSLDGFRIEFAGGGSPLNIHRNSRRRWWWPKLDLVGASSAFYLCSDDDYDEERE